MNKEKNKENKLSDSDRGILKVPLSIAEGIAKNETTKKVVKTYCEATIGKKATKKILETQIGITKGFLDCFDNKKEDNK